MRVDEVSSASNLQASKAEEIDEAYSSSVVRFFEESNMTVDMTKRKQWGILSLVLMGWIIPCIASDAGEPTASPAFAVRPVATKVGNGARITFTVSAQTDVAVYVEDAKGGIVRHLAAGALGKKPPEPLKADSLSQTLEWDGMDDDGQPAVGGPFKVRVGLGLKASWAGVSFAGPGEEGPSRIERIMGLACGPDGRLYVLDGCDAWVFKNGSRVLVLRRDGSYEKTIKPFSPTLPIDRVKGIGAFVNSFGAVNPVIFSPHGLSFYPQQEVAHQPAVTADGHLVLAGQTSDPRPHAAVPTLAMIDGDGGLPNATYAGSVLAKALWKSPYPCLAAASGGGAVYLTGLGVPDAYVKAGAWHAVYRVKLPERAPAELFFGDPDKAGSDNAHLSDPRGLATDGKGHLLVADFGNNRVVVINEKDKSFVSSFSVEQPSWVAVHPKTGAVYVCSKQTCVVKFSSLTNPTEQARVDFSDYYSGLLNRAPRDYRSGASMCFALDASAEPAVLWAACVAKAEVARMAGGDQLVRCEDQGAKFSAPIPTACTGAILYRRPAADPTRKEVACLREGRLYVLNEESGTNRVVGSPGRGSVTAGQARNPRLDRDGKIYCVDHEAGLIRYSPDGKPLPFSASTNLPYLRGRLPAGATGTTWWEGGFWVDRKGDIYVRKDGLRYHGQKCLQVYDRDGNFKRTAIWALSDAGYGPKTDAQGNIYIMDIAKPIGQPFPEEFGDHVVPNPDSKDEYFGPSEPGRPTASVYNWMYGSIIKFSSEGGAMWMGNAQGGPNQLDYEGWRGIAMELRTTGGALTGGMFTNPQYPTWLVFPALNLDASTHNKITIRLKNATDGNQATLGYSVNWYPGSACDGSLGRYRKVIEIKPNSDFTEYTFDMSGEKEWKERIHWLTLIPSNGKKGTFSIDWVRICGAGDTMAWNFDKEDAQDRKLPSTLNKTKAIADHCPEGVELQGALWMRPGFSPTYSPSGGTERCRCTGTEFDVDDFGRVYAPDLGRFRVGVLDANGNDVLSFGAYGNQDFCGHDSYVFDPDTKLLRPRKVSDPKDLVSPYAQPEIAFAWIMGLAVTDKYAYVADVINKRVLRVKLDYAVEEDCIIK